MSVGELSRRFGQLFDDGLHFSAQRIGTEHERTDDACHHHHGACNARNLDGFKPYDERIQRVGDDDAEQQWHQECLRPGQNKNHRERRKNFERHARINGQPRRGNRDQRCFDGSVKLLHGVSRVGCAAGDRNRDGVHSVVRTA